MFDSESVKEKCATYSMNNSMLGGVAIIFVIGLTLIIMFFQTQNTSSINLTIKENLLLLHVKKLHSPVNRKCRECWVGLESMLTFHITDW